MYELRHRLIFTFLNYFSFKDKILTDEYILTAIIYFTFYVWIALESLTC